MATVIRGSAATYSSATAGRAICQVRSSHFVTDDPAGAPYGGPGDAPSSLELFLSGITSCAVLMLERIARAQQLPLARVHAEMEAARDVDQVTDGIPVLDEARLSFTLWGLTSEQAGQLVETFKGR
jgi:uncharacterized OsmC-like protein